MNDYDVIMLFILQIFKIGAAAVVTLLGLIEVCAALYLTHFFLTLPMRRAERARLFLDLIESTLRQGRPLEETIISLSHSRDGSMGVKLHQLAAWLETGLRFDEALAKVPRFLPPQVNAMLRAGKKIGDLAKVLPASRHLLGDSVSQTRGALNYLVIMTFVITPVSCFVFGMLMVFVFPRYMDIAAGMGFAPSHGIIFLGLLLHYNAVIFFMEGIVLFLLWLAAFVYIGGPRVTAWFPILERLHYRLPWRRRRMQRDFSTLLAVLLDAGVPESEALTLAAECSANSVFRRRAARAAEGLRQGMKLPEAVHLLDDSGEFRWRLRNAAAAPGGFFRALAGWHDALDAKAFQQEQAAAHGITTALVLWSGLIVGALTISVFAFLASTINAGVLW